MVLRRPRRPRSSAGHATAGLIDWREFYNHVLEKYEHDELDKARGVAECRSRWHEVVCALQLEPQARWERQI